MKPRSVIEEDLTFWGGTLFTMAAPEGATDILDLTCILMEDGSVISPWVLDEDDFTEVVTTDGFTVWLRCWGGMVPTTITLLSDSREE